MPKFKEIKSGLVYEYTNPWDIAQMRTHPEYLEIKEQIDPKTSKITEVVVEKSEQEGNTDGYSVATSKRGPKKAS